VALPLVRGAQRLFWLVVACHLAIAAWAVLFAYDRYLQTLVPLMAAGIAALAIKAARTGWPARFGLVLLGGVQLVWGIDMVFWPVHKMTAKSGMALASDFFGQTYEKQFRARTQSFDHRAAIGRASPNGSKLLRHHEHMRLGLKHQTVWAWPRFQFGISYGRIASSRDLHRLFKQYGITHVTWVAEQVFGDDSYASDLVFHTYVSQHLVNAKPVGGRMVAELPSTEPRIERPLVFYFGCGALPAGLYRLPDLHVLPLRAPGVAPTPYRPPVRPLGDDVEGALSEVDRALIDTRCKNAPSPTGFDRHARQGTLNYFARAR
jgi:hypothetical protein